MSRHNTELLNTHYYDGKLEEIHPLVKVIHYQQKDDLTCQKKDFFKELIQNIKIYSNISSRYRQTAIMAIDIITKDIHSVANYDHTNGMYADDVLYLVCKHIRESDGNDVLPYLAEQLSDIITSGRCSQGRCTRIFQVLLAVGNKNQNQQENCPVPFDSTPNPPTTISN